MMKRTLVIALAVVFGACSGSDAGKDAAGESHDGHSHDGHSHDGDSHDAHPDDGHPGVGPHGGAVLEVGDHVAHLEVLHDEAAGKMTIHVLGADVKTPMTVSKAPQLKVSTDAGPKVIATTAQGGTAGASSVFVATDPALKGHTHGRISIEIKGKTYNPELAHDH